MKMNRMIVLVGIAGLTFGLVAEALESDLVYSADFTDTNTYTVGNQLTGVDGWDASNQGVIDANGAIDVLWNLASTNTGFSTAVNANAESLVVKDALYTSAITFTFEIQTPTNSGNGPVIQSGFFMGPTNNSARLAMCLVRNGAVTNVYRLLALDNWGNHYPIIGGVTNKYNQSGTFTEASLGLDYANADYVSDTLKLETKLLAGASVNDWTLSATLYNVTKASTVYSYAVGAITWSPLEGDSLYGGFGTGQGGANIQVLNRYVKSYEYLELLPPVALIQWGKPNGANDIVDGTDPALTNGIPVGNNWYKMEFANGSQWAGGLGANTTYQPGDVSSPTNSTYYTNNVGFSPNFNFTFNDRYWDKAVRDNDPWNHANDYDLIEISGGNGVTNIQYMMTWESFVTDPTLVSAFEVEMQADNYTNIATEVRFIFKGANEAWYASAPTSIDGAGWTPVSVNAETVQWYDFSVMTNGAAVIGAAATPDLANIKAAGVWYNRTASSAQYGVVGNLRFFRVSGRSGSLWQAFVASFNGLLSGVKTDDYDQDGLNDYGEYVFGGDPTDGDDLGILPEFDAVSGKYTYSLVGDSTVVAHLQTNGDLVNGSWTTVDTVVPTQDDSLMYAYTNTTGTAESQKFIKISVE